MKKLILLAAANVLCTTFLHAQGWMGNSPDVLYPLNNGLSLSPLRVGIGLSAPSEQLHTNEGVRFEGLKLNSNPDRLVVQDNSGVLYWFPFPNISGGNFWSLAGNAGTVPGTDYLGTSDNKRLVIATNAIERMTVTNTGQVGIGNTTPVSQLQVHTTVGDMNMALSGSAPSVKFHGGINTPANAPGSFTVPYAKIGLATSNYHFVTTSRPGDFILQTIDTNKSIIFSARFDASLGSGLEQMRLTGAGNLGIGTTTPNQRLVVFNGVTTGSYTSTGWVHSSDRRLKNDIQPINDAMGLVRKLNGVYFHWISNKNAGRQVGFIAQEVRQVLPEVVLGKEGDMNKGEVLQMAYQNIVPVLVEALKEKDQQITKLQHHVAELEDKNRQIADLQQRLNYIESLLSKQAENTTGNDLTLDQNAPNPFTDITSINYAIPQPGKVLVELFGQDGKKIKTLENGNRSKGRYTVQINGSDLPAGTYIYTLSLNGRQLSRKAIKL